MQDCACRVLVTADEGRRGGKTIHLKKIADEALKECPLVNVGIVVRRHDSPFSHFMFLISSQKHRRW